MKYPKDGEVRHVWRFALWPVNVNGRTLWLLPYRRRLVWRESYYRPVLSGWQELAGEKTGTLTGDRQ